MNAPPRSLPATLRRLPCSRTPTANSSSQPATLPARRASSGRPSTPISRRDRAPAWPSCARHSPPAIELHYAMKANPMPALVGHMAPRLTASTSPPGELQVALDAGRSAPRQLRRSRQARHRTAPGGGRRHLVNVESFRELAPPEASAALGMPARVAVRGESGLRAQVLGHEDGRRPQPFGVDAERSARQLLAAIGRAPARLRGLPPLRRLAEPARRAIVEAQRRASIALRLAAHAPARCAH